MSDYLDNSHPSSSNRRWSLGREEQRPPAETLTPEARAELTLIEDAEARARRAAGLAPTTYPIVPQGFLSLTEKQLDAWRTLSREEQYAACRLSRDEVAAYLEQVAAKNAA